MPLNPATACRLVQLAQASADAPRGTRHALMAQACAELGISQATLHRHLGQITLKTPRKQRDDCGAVALPRTQAIAISAALMTSQRKTDKRLMSIAQAVAVLRANGEVRAEYLDADSGELRPLSDSAIARGLRAHGVHPDQLNRPAPAVQLKSLHPNHVWQIDASICVLYYLASPHTKEAGLQVMERTKFYKNKPSNLKRIENERVWSYEVTDHYSGAVFVHYVLGAESGVNLADSFVAAIQKREGDPLHGVPFVLMMDMGSANTGGLFANLARRLQMQLIAHSPGNARATGQVEKARDQIERSFESSLRLKPVRDLADLNLQAQRWATWYNANAIHSRHAKTRYDVWLTIGPEQLRIAPALEVCRELLTQFPEPRKVSDFLTVQFKGVEFDVRSVPGVMVGEKLPITSSPYQTDAALVLLKDADGHELLHSIPRVGKDSAGFADTANVIGEDYARPKDTQLETNRKEVERFAFDASTDDEAAAKRKANVTPFGGRIDPYKVIEQAPQRTWLPKAGAEIAVAVTTQAMPAPVRLLTAFEAASELARLGVALTPELRALLPADGLPEDALAALAARHAVRAGLRVIAGGAV